MNEQHKGSMSEDNFVSEEGQRDLLCCNKKSLRCPSFDYYQVESIGHIEYAFDLIFNETLTSNQENKNYGTYKIDRGIRTSIKPKPRK